MKIDFNIASIWAALVTTGTAMLWLFTNIAWASDIDRIEVRLIKQELRELRAELRQTQDEDYRRALEEAIEEAIDDLCYIDPADRECD
jgi:deoxyribodipyrimidine photolyase